MSLTVSERMVWHNLQVFFHRVRGNPILVDESDPSSIQNNWQQFPPGINSTFCGMTGCLNVDSASHPRVVTTAAPAASADPLVDFLFRIMSVLVNLFPSTDTRNASSSSEVAPLKFEQPSFFQQLLEYFFKSLECSKWSTLLQVLSPPRKRRSPSTETPPKFRRYPTIRVYLHTSSPLPFSIPTPDWPGTGDENGGPVPVTFNDQTGPYTTEQPPDTTEDWASLAPDPAVSPKTLQPSKNRTAELSTFSPKVLTTTAGMSSSDTPMTLFPPATKHGQSSTTTSDLPAGPLGGSPDDVGGEGSSTPYDHYTYRTAVLWDSSQRLPPLFSTPPPFTLDPSRTYFPPDD